MDLKPLQELDMPFTEKQALALQQTDDFPRVLAKLTHTLGSFQKLRRIIPDDAWGSGFKFESLGIIGVIVPNNGESPGQQNGQCNGN